MKTKKSKSKSRVINPAHSRSGKRKILKRQNKDMAKLSASVNALAQSVAGIRFNPDHPEDFFRDLSLDRQIDRVMLAERRGHQRLLLRAYSHVILNMQHFETAPFKAAIATQRVAIRGGAKDPILIMLRTMIDYENLPDRAGGKRHRATAQKDASADAAAIRFLISEQLTPDAVRKRFEAGETRQTWIEGWRALQRSPGAKHQGRAPTRRATFKQSHEPVSLTVPREGDFRWPLVRRPVVIAALEVEAVADGAAVLKATFLSKLPDGTDSGSSEALRDRLSQLILVQRRRG